MIPMTVTRFFHRKTYCPMHDEQVTYNENCRSCDYNQFFDSALDAVDCSYTKRGDNDE